VRPTSETIIYAMFAKWIHSYRDLPLLINQWCNIVRWEFRTRLFLRTTEFLWQEGTRRTPPRPRRRRKRVRCSRVSQVPGRLDGNGVITVAKPRARGSPARCGPTRLSPHAGQQGTAGGTSHNLGQNFAKAFDLQYQTAAGGLEHAWNTSWGYRPG